MDTTTYELKPIPREIPDSKDEDDIYLTVVIGNGQIGGNIVKMGDTVLAKGNLSQPAFIGKVKDLKDKEFTVYTNVVDTNQMTNLCVISTTFKNQENKTLYSNIDKGDAPEGGIASFIGKYFVKLVIGLFILFYGSMAYCQETVQFKDLEMPSTPGLILTDQSQSSIEKPTTPQGVGLAILGFYKGKGGAFEFAPFWLMGHPKLTAEKMYKNKFPVLSDLAVSVASSNKDSVVYLSGGIRTRVIQVFGVRILSKLDSIKIELENALSVEPQNLDLSKIEELKSAYINLYDKPIFNLDIAAAIGGDSYANAFDSLDLNRWAAWLTINYRPKGEDFYATILSRYIHNVNFAEYADDADLVDLGARLNYDINKLSLSLEYIQRLNFTENIYNDYRLAIVGSYKIMENFFLTSTFGKNFSEVHNIIALVGINVGYSKTKMKAYSD
jgi:hypothetical protein